MGGVFGIYNGNVIRPLLQRIAKEKGVTYEEVKKCFVEKFAVPDTKKLKEKIESFGRER